MCKRTRVRRHLRGASRSTTNLQTEVAAFAERQGLLHLKTGSSITLLHRVGAYASVASDRGLGSCSGNFTRTAGKFAGYHPQSKLCARGARRAIRERSPPVPVDQKQSNTLCGTRGTATTEACGPS